VKDGPRVVAVIPARGGTDRIPYLNIKRLGDRALLAHTLDAAKAAKTVDRVIVSTDDAEIAAVSREWGAEVPFIRPSEYAQDLSPDIDAFRHALLWLEENEGYRPDRVVHLRPPGPVRRIELIDRAIDLLAAHPEADAVRSVRPAPLTPYKMWRILPEGYMEPLLRVEGMTDCQSQPRQRLPQVYWQSGYVDVVRPRAILEKNSMWGEVVLPFIVDEPLFELDYPEDIPAIEDALKRLAAGLPLESEQTAGRHAV
jgi:N-acylneuraminate cytidylyltransferase